ncbi:MAG: hypothetical protein WBL63_16710 [Candidatus Acidiferrum sp.]
MTSTKETALCAVFCGVMLAVGTKSQTLDNGTTQATKTYADSRAGIEEQFADILQVVRTSDEPSIHKALDTLSIPDANGWISAHFVADDAVQEQQAYQQALEKFKSHVWWVTGNFGKYPEFALKVEESQNAPPLSDVGFEGLVPRPKDAVRVENYRFLSTVNDPKLGNPSWVSSFIYLVGRFRMIGGTYPFWAEGLNATRGPMSLPPKVIRGRTVQAQAFRNDTKGPGIDAIVHIKIEVGHDGKVKKMKVLSGDGEFIPDAQQYLKEAEFPKLPDDPRLANMKAVWDMEVVFFTPKSSSSLNP